MIPVTIDNDGTVKKADISSEWYNYEMKEWANIALVNEASRSNYVRDDVGTTIENGDILAYFVWIPRYRYQLFNAEGATGTTPQEIQIIFENKDTAKSNGTNNTEWLTHPAFTFGTEELNGIWVGKFETTGTNTDPTILPKVTSLRSQNISEQFSTSLLFSNNTLNTDGSITSFGTNTTYGLTNVDSHMAKNSEWGAISYLTQSKYGKNGNVNNNNITSFITGCGASDGDDLFIPVCEIGYGLNGANYPQSTTGNITGIFDMAGGAGEYVMGKYFDMQDSVFLVELPEEKYYQTYTDNQNILGDAMFETYGWYSDSFDYPNSNNNWILRNTINEFMYSNGYAFYGGGLSNRSFRVVLVS